MTTFNWWTIVGPAMLVLSILMGYFSVRREDCAVYVRDISVVIVLMSVSTGLLFAIMVMSESYVGLVDFVLRHFVAAGESEAWADIMTAGILLGTFVAYAVIFGLVCCLSADLHESYLRKQAQAIRHDHYNARQDPAKLAELREQCCQASCGPCPAGLHKIGRDPMNEDAPLVNVADHDAKERLQRIFAWQRANGKAQMCVLELPCEAEAQCEIIDLRPQTEKIG